MKRTRSIGESPLLSRHPAGHGAPGRATLHGVTSELSFRDPYPLLHINCKQDTIEQGQPEACLYLLEMFFVLRLGYWFQTNVVLSHILNCLLKWVRQKKSHEVLNILSSIQELHS